MAAGYNWRRGLGPSLLLIAGTIAYAAWIGRGHSPDVAVRFWALIGALVLGELILGLATSYLAQSGRVVPSRLLNGAVTIALLAGAWWYPQRAQSATFTGARRRAGHARRRPAPRRDARDHRRQPALPDERLWLEAARAGADRRPAGRHVTGRRRPFGRAGELPAVAGAIRC
jgi:hypothetical protein